MLSVMKSNNFELDKHENSLSRDKSQPKSRVSEEPRVSSDDDVDRSVGLEQSVRVSEDFDDRTPESDVNDSDNDRDRRKAGSRERGKPSVSEYDSMLSMFDEYAANGKGRAKQTNRYAIGDMVWGKVKSHPWWPGHVFDEAFASASVRRSKRRGLVLVAFFGDSSYGWFDPDELIPFEPHYEEKSKQINSRTFVKAVEEAADEASRRSGLGLACRCRNPFNFRPANVPGYFAVDMADNEPASMYSTDQIKEAQDGFRARDTLGFMKQLALMPRGDGHERSLGFMKDRAAVLAYRRAVYEEFDETYAQAFGQPAVRPTAESKKLSMQSVRAPLSGPMVFAETLRKKKTPIKSSKMKDQAHEDKYLFKRRDETKELKSQKQGQPTSSMQPAIQVSTELADGEYVLQRRTLPGLPDQHSSEKILLEQVTPMEDKPSAVDRSMVKSPSSYGDSFTDPTGNCDSFVTKDEEAKCDGDRDQKNAITSKLVEGDPPQSFRGQDSSVKLDGTKKKKILKGPAEDMGADRSVTLEKKKKRKKDSGMEMSSGRKQKLGPAGKGVSGDKSGRSFKLDVEHHKNDDRNGDLLPDSVGKTEFKFFDLLSDLRSLALNPFHGRERNSPAYVRQTFLKFRSLVFQKSLALTTPSEVEQNENYSREAPPSSSLGSDNVHSNIKDHSSSKPLKPVIRSEDPTKGGRKRGPSDRQEEIAAKRMKKVSEMKSLSADKKAAMKTSGVQRDGKDVVVPRPQKPLRSESGKKMEPPRRVRELTILVMKFPPQSTLPSENELKARIARFGPLDHSRTRIFWKSFTCRVVFLFKTDAEAAHRHLSGNNHVFGNVKVRCHTRPLEGPAPSDVENKAQRDDVSVFSASDVRPLSANPTVQMKSCLKKPAVGEASPTTGGNGGSKGAARVKFVLDEGEYNSGGELLASKNNLKDTSFAGSGIGASSSSSATTIKTSITYGMDLNSKKFQQKVVLENPLSNFHAPQISSQNPYSQNNFQHPQKAPPPTGALDLSTNVPVVAQAGTSSTHKDIAQEMLRLMNRCDEVVGNLKSSMGYVPYYPL